MKKTLKAVIAMVLVLSLGFLMLSTTAFAAVSSERVAPQAAGIGDFFKSLFKKISDSIKSFFNKIIPSKKPEPEPETTTGAAGEENVIFDNSEDKGDNIGSDAVYAGGIW